MRQIKRRAETRPPGAAESSAGFVELLPREASAGAPSAIEVELASGHRLRLTGEVDVELVARLVSALSRC